MNPTYAALYAEEIIRLQDQASLATPFSECLTGFNAEDAYAISAEVLRRREAAGWRRIGRKIGFTNHTIWDQYGVYEPIFGYMYDQTVIEAAAGPGTPSSFSATVPLDGLVQPLIEPEIVFRMKASPPDTRDPVALLEAIASVGHGFELVQCHFPGWKFGVADTIADGGLHGRYIVGGQFEISAEMRAFLPVSLESFTIALLKDGEACAWGGGDLVLGSPLNALGHLVRVLGDLPGHPQLEPGELVTTGTLTTAMPVSSGETWSTQLEGLALPGMSLRLT